MASDNIIYYDDEFIRKFEKLKDVIEAGDRARLHRFLIDNFGYIFTACQHYWRYNETGAARDFDEADDETKGELMRPLTHRQYRMVERSFSRWKEEEEDAVAAIWDFLDDSGKIYDKKVMSVAEVCGCSMILEQVYRLLG
ncbi:MAG: hypothetical protein IJJ61_05285 [Clostridia bacterium]|nr:hypothetical protein [Clostridia bacterium]